MRMLLSCGLNLGSEESNRSAAARGRGAGGAPAVRWSSGRGWRAGSLALLAGAILGLGGCALGRREAAPPREGEAAVAGPAGTGVVGGTLEAPAPPVVILVSLDGVRWDYVERYALQHLARLASEGVRAEYLRPSFPTSTFPNHYTLVTGLVPGRHGIIANRFWEPRAEVDFNYGAPLPQSDAWWGGEPIWVTAEKQGRKSACMFWPGSEAEIGGVRPTHYFPYKQETPIAARVAQVLAWLDLPPAERPQVITLYFHHTDTAGHVFGVDSEPLREAAARLDAAMGELRAGIEQRGLTGSVNLVVTADHGMTNLDQARVRLLDEWVQPDRDVRVSYFGAVTGLWPLPPQTVASVMEKLAGLPEDFTAYRREDLPPRWRLADQERMGPVVIVARPGARLVPRALVERPNYRPEAATHGYDNAHPEMGALFIAWGPRYRRGVRLPVADNTHVYRLLCATVGLEPAPGDGSDVLVRGVLRR